MVSKRQFTKLAAGLCLSATLPAPARSLTSGSAREHGFWMPEESEPHLRTFMQWPVSKQVNTDPVFLRMLQKTIADIANTIAEFEPVVLLMDDRFAGDARKSLGASVEIWNIPTEDLWARDSGPLFVIDGKGGLALSQVNFNGWGGKQVHANDGAIAARVARRLGLPVFDNGIVGEAGGVESDGHGTLIAHASCWVNPNRNSGAKDEVEQLLLDTLGARKMIWAPGVKGADITDYHIDALARFAAPGVVLIQLPEKPDRNDPWSVSAYETFEILKSATDANGNKLNLVTVPEPKKPRVKAPDFVASYVNYYVCNRAVIAAQFGDRDTDQEASAILGGLYPGREIVTLNVDPVGESGGGIHCATQQQPRV